MIAILSILLLFFVICSSLLVVQLLHKTSQNADLLDENLYYKKLVKKIQNSCLQAKGDFIYKQFD